MRNKIALQQEIDEIGEIEKFTQEEIEAGLGIVHMPIIYIN